MSLNNPRSSFGSASEFTVSGLPWVTSSVAPTTTAKRFDFAKITKTITVRNLASGSAEQIAVGFTRDGINGTNRFVVPAGSEMVFETRVKSVYLLSLDASSLSFSMYAGLTTIDASEMPHLTGSLWEGV